ncbi:MAG: anthranilate synthase component I [Proteobacteria bacterium]|nr:anthranilate synthase component I [Pseudomonadota bacterium]MBU1059399.1 anthranilate synthase component I [Pseudomonadota bacterium]
MPSITHLPDYETFLETSKTAGLIPVYRTIIADLDTPLTLLAKISGEESHIFLFESMEGGEKWGRYSFIGFDPLLTFSSKDSHIDMHSFSDGLSKYDEKKGNPLEVLEKILKEIKAAENADLPRFCGGAVGFLGYDMVRFIEELPSDIVKLDFPDCSFMIPRVVLIHDSFKQTVTVVCWVASEENVTSRSSYEAATTKIDSVVSLLRAPVPASFLGSSSRGSKQQHQFHSNMDPQQFHTMVEKAREYIIAGDIIQVVLSQRFHTKTDLSSLDLYRALRHINPSPYLFYLKLGELIQIGSSPEILVRKEGEVIELRPIAGTRIRGKTEEEDKALELELLADPKERAEHLMLVDLGRNDVSRVARDGSVKVKDLLVVERYSHVMHIVSGVHAIIGEGKNQFDVMKACFPAGTVSGAPKIRAMEIIDELEPEGRGPYAGAVGYFGFSGNMDFCITIRTFIMQGEDLWVQAGAGVVFDSDPQKEYEETINKSMGLRRAVELAEKGF